MKYFFITIVILLSFTQIYAQQTGTFKDPRDGRVYRTTTYTDVLKGKEVTWFAENLDYKTSSDSWAYNFDEEYRKNLGLLYTWDAAIQACPNGWHLPSKNEWDFLVNQYGGWKVAGQDLKSKNGWYENGDGTNISGFNLFPAGGGYNEIGSDYHTLGYSTRLWESTVIDKGSSYARNFWYKESAVHRENTNTDYGCSVRCIKD